MTSLVLGWRYRAQVHLGFFEAVASNDTIAQKLRDAGFVEVVVGGAGRTRVAEGRWALDTQAVDLPEQIESVEVLP